MEELINADYVASLNSTGRKGKNILLLGKSGDNIFINCSPKRCEAHFEVLCGLHLPDVGIVKIFGKDPYNMTPKEAAAFRRDLIGAVPHNLGLIPEMRMIDQIALPMKLIGIDSTTILEEIKKLSAALMPLYDLCNIPGKCNTRKQAYAAILRAVICNPKIIVMNGFLDDMPDADADALWQAFHTIRPQNSVLIYLSGAPAPTQVNWTQYLRG